MALVIINKEIKQFFVDYLKTSKKMTYAKMVAQ